MTDNQPRIIRLIEIDQKDVNLKFFFDHFRNYLICAALAAAARLINTGEETIPYLGFLAGYMIAITAMVLFFLNTFQGAMAVSLLVFAEKRYIRGGYTVIWMLIAASYIHLIFTRVH